MPVQLGTGACARFAFGLEKPEMVCEHVSALEQQIILVENASVQIRIDHEV
jgi:hypothetical protein